MTRGTLEFLLSLLEAQQIHVGAPDAEQTAQLAFRALNELKQALSQEEA